MSLKLKDAMSMEYLEEFTLVAGEGGLDRFINTIGILDHEMIEDMMHIFVEGEFVLSTMSVARDDSNLVFQSVRSLIEQNVAALAIKAVYYKSLPQEIIDYANAHNFPIFLFQPAIFIEDVIRTVFSGIKSRGMHSLMEIKLETLFSGSVNPNTVHDIAMELNSDFLPKTLAIYCQEKRFLSDDNVIRTIDKYMRISNRNRRNGLFKFRKGIMIILSSEPEDKMKPELDLQYLFDSLGLNRSDFVMGMSTEQSSLYTLDKAIKESFFAYQTALLTNEDALPYESIGLYKLLMSISDQPWTIQYTNTLLDPLFKYDDKYKTKLYETIKLYFDAQGKTAVVAEQLYQHKNTILQRIRKVKELTGPFKSDQDFFEQLSTAIKLYEIRNL